MLDHNPTARNIELKIAYQGQPFHGWQVQPHKPTVQGIIRKALHKILKSHNIKTVGSSRTDSGVHAHDQRVGFTMHNPMPIESLKRALNNLLPPEITVIAAAERDPRHSVRYHARGKHYSYLFYNGPKPDPFVHPYVWEHRRPLDVEAMHQAAQAFVGTREFKALQSARDHRDYHEATIFQTSVTRYNNILCFDVLGHHFLYHMVRNMTGSLAMVGRGEWTVQELEQRLNSGDRTLMGMTAPAQGLHLIRVFFEGETIEFDERRDNFLRRIS